MRRVDITLPDLGEDSVQAVTVSGWLAQPGQTLAEGDDLLELVTDKAAFTLPTPQAGTLSRMLVNEGDKVRVGDALCVLEVTD
jgi:pyruvate/2-oxoglutarate dehydrogenase complex dihydrolipoamide acyltransferase (E2) component